MRHAYILVVLGLLVPSYALAADSIGQIRNASGNVDVTRAGAAQHAAVGEQVFQDDVISTGADGSVGITFADNSLISLGPNSELKLDQFQFNPAAHTGNFDTSLNKGTLAVKSGMIVQQNPESMRIHMQAATLGVRGTEFVVRAAGPDGQ
jgi:hypothetical protein